MASCQREMFYCWACLHSRQEPAGIRFLLSFNMRDQSYVCFSQIMLVIYKREKSSGACHTNDLARLGTPGSLICIFLRPSGDYLFTLVPILLGN